MKPKRVRIPQIVHHKPSGRDAVFLLQPDKSRRMVYLGPHGSAESQRAYQAVLADYLRGKSIHNARKSVETSSDWPSVAQLCAAFMLHAERYYTDGSGKRSREVVNFMHALRPLLAMHRDTPTDRFDVPSLKAVRDVFGAESINEDGKTRCRNYVNACVRRIKQVFRWGVESGHVPGETWNKLSAIKGLARNRGGLRESKPVEPIERADIDAIAPYLTDPIAAAIELQWWTGMRPSEALTIRTMDIERPPEGPWIYRPQEHKSEWRGRERKVMLGTNARNIVRRLLKADPRAYLICPRDVHRRDSRPEGERYGIDSYRKAIHRACDRAGIPRWSPHRIRHAAGTRLTLAEGTEAAGAALGHVDDRMTRHYSKQARDRLAAKVAERHG